MLSHLLSGPMFLPGGMMSLSVWSHLPSMGIGMVPGVWYQGVWSGGGGGNKLLSLIITIY